MHVIDVMQILHLSCCKGCIQTRDVMSRVNLYHFHLSQPFQSMQRFGDAPHWGDLCSCLPARQVYGTVSIWRAGARRFYDTPRVKERARGRTSRMESSRPSGTKKKVAPWSRLRLFVSRRDAGRSAVDTDYGGIAPRRHRVAQNESVWLPRERNILKARATTLHYSAVEE